jgi:hypothetical protein
MTLKDTEFQILRDTIARRGTLRQALLPATLASWGAVAALLLAFREDVSTALFALGVLVGGFEAIHALHVGVERIGRYLQVFYETNADGPLWESTAMRLGPGLPGSGVDPLFTAVFLAATVANLSLVTLPPGGTWDYVVLAAHAVFIVRVVRARRAAAQQRAVDLETFTAVRSQLIGASPGPAARNDAAHDRSGI